MTIITDDHGWNAELFQLIKFFSMQTIVKYKWMGVFTLNIAWINQSWELVTQDIAWLAFIEEEKVQINCYEPQRGVNISWCVMKDQGEKPGVNKKNLDVLKVNSSYMYAQKNWTVMRTAGTPLLSTFSCLFFF